MDRHPTHIFILDHLAKPRIKDKVLFPWNRNSHEIAKRRNVYCKLSGMITEADPARWTPESLQPYIDVALDDFGPARLMYGSDWPVMLPAGEYAESPGGLLPVHFGVSGVSFFEARMSAGRSVERNTVFACDRIRHGRLRRNSECTDSHAEVQWLQ